METDDIAEFMHRSGLNLCPWQIELLRAVLDAENGEELMLLPQFRRR